MHAVAYAAFGRSFRGFAAGVAVAASIASFGLCPQRALATTPPPLPSSPPLTPTATPTSTTAAEPGSATAGVPESVTTTVTATPAAAAAAASAASAGEATEELMEIVVQGRGPRFVSRTRRDEIGRIWAPVLINGRGPFRLVLDTGASHSGVTRIVPLVLGIPTDQAPPVILNGVTGSTKVPTIRVDSLSVGDLAVEATLLPILPDAFGGAEGVLGYEGLYDKRIFIDFRRDLINITFSRGEKPAQGYLTIPFRSIGGQLVVIDAIVGHVRTKAIIDTGGQTTIANMALHRALARRSTQPQ